MKRVVALAIFLAIGLYAQEPPQTPEAGGKPQDPLSSGTFAGFRLRSIGPALMSGRISCIAVHPEDKHTWYIGVASGGVWKTTNAGITWTPVFQNEGSYSIGALIDRPEEPQHHLGRHRRGQQSAQRGLRRRHLSQRRRRQDRGVISVSRPPNRSGASPSIRATRTWCTWRPTARCGVRAAIAACTRPSTAARTGHKVLNISENTGISDVAIDPSNPDVLLAVAHQRRRHVWTMIHGGPESGLHKSTDAGKTWRRVRGIGAGGGAGIGAAVSAEAARQIWAASSSRFPRRRKVWSTQRWNRRKTRWPFSPRPIPAKAGNAGERWTPSPCTTRTSTPISGIRIAFTS